MFKQKARAGFNSIKTDKVLSIIRKSGNRFSEKIMLKQKS